MNFRETGGIVTDLCMQRPVFFLALHVRTFFGKRSIPGFLLAERRFMEKIAAFNDVINSFVWGKGVWLLIATGVLMTILTKVFQVSHVREWWKNTIGSLFKKDVIRHTNDKASISPFQALCTALAATVGTGNIAGVSAAIVIGGAGAVFWMWVAAFFGMMTNYAENVLGIYYRRKNANGEWSGGPMYYLQDGLGGYKGMKIVGKVLAVIFALFAMLASFGIGSMGQVNKIVLNIENAFPVNALQQTILFDNVNLYQLIIGIGIMLLVAAIVLGGLKRIAAFAEKVVPVMIILFLVGALAIIGANYANIIPAFGAIFTNAFKPVAALGGGVGFVISTVMTQGFKRGVFSNEAGLGSSVMVHSNSNVKEPVKQGMWGIFEVFADTIIVCTVTALVVLTSGVYNLQTGAIAEGTSDATLVATAFNNLLPWGGIGAKFVAVAMFLFAFTTVLGWSHYGTKAWEYVFGAKSTVVFKIIHVLTTVFGAVLTSSLAWDISDTFNGLMMLPNLIGVIAMSGVVMKITKNYIDRKKRGLKVEPVLSYDLELQKQQAEELAKEEAL